MRGGGGEGGGGGGGGFGGVGVGGLGAWVVLGWVFFSGCGGARWWAGPKPRAFVAKLKAGKVGEEGGEDIRFTA